MLLNPKLNQQYIQRQRMIFCGHFSVHEAEAELNELEAPKLNFFLEVSTGLQQFTFLTSHAYCN